MPESDPYITSEFYSPGFIFEVGFFAAAMIAVVSLFLLTIIGSRYVLLTSKRLKPRTRRILRLMAGLARESRPRRRREREAELHRERQEPIRLKAAPAGAQGAALAGGFPTRREGPPAHRRFSADLALRPDEAGPP